MAKAAKHPASSSNALSLLWGPRLMTSLTPSILIAANCASVGWPDRVEVMPQRRQLITSVGSVRSFSVVQRLAYCALSFSGRTVLCLCEGLQKLSTFRACIWYVRAPGLVAVDGGLSPTRACMGRMGRGTKPPPQLWQTLLRTLFTQSAQNVHS